MDNGYIKQIMETIVSRSHKEPRKKTVREYTDRLNFACIYCGDSERDINAKRGNLYYNTLIYKCFNCEHVSNFDRVCKEQHISIDPDKKLAIIKHLDGIVTYKDYEDNLMENGLKHFLSVKELEEYCNELDFNINKSRITELKPLQKGSLVQKALEQRGIPIEMCKNIYQAKYWKFDKYYEPVMVFMNRRNDALLSIQVRNLKGKNQRFFKIFNYENIYKWLNNYGDIDEGDLDINTISIYNKLSYFFNILHVDFDKDITLFEGYLDSLFFPNSIGAVGTNTDTRFLEDNDIEIKFFYDNDNTGNKKTLEKIENGNKVFLWNKLFDYVVEQKTNSDPYKLRSRIASIKDLNALAELTPNPYENLKLENFFSNDIFDKRYIPPIEKTKWRNFEFKK